jgi:hypothetical protein
MTSVDDIAERIEANLSQGEANLRQADVNSAEITSILAVINSARWRRIRNRRLLNRCHALANGNRELARANESLLAENGRLLAIHLTR